MTDVAQTTPRTTVGLFALAAGLSVGRYVITSVLGQGGFGITYRARDSQLDRDVAIKEYLPATLAVRQDGITVLPRSTEFAEDFIWGRDRFVAEGRTLASLHDAPAIVRVFDFLESNGTAYIVMELVPGETLDSRLQRLGPFTPPEVDAVLPPLLDGLEQVHKTGFLHRDIKPANILLRPDGRPVLIDFGASRASMAGRSTAMTAIFTPGFAAAEQMTSARQGPWTDIYGLSATMYAAISGTAPPPAFDRMLEDTFQPLSRLAPEGFSPTLLDGLDAGLAVRVNDRPQSIAAWRKRLRGIASDTPETESPEAAATVLLGTPMARDASPSREMPSSQGIPIDATVAFATPTPSQSATGARKSLARYAGLAILALLLVGGGYYALQDGPKTQPSAALQDMKVEDLERALDARRRADAEAAEKRRLEEEAQKKANDDADAKRRADSELEQARQDRLNAERELEKLRAQLEDQKKAADAQRQTQIEDEQRRAETAAADKRRLEEEAQKKADLEAKQTAEAQAALARAQADREKADAEARSRQEEEVRQRADADARTRAEADAREKEKAAADKAKQEADEKKAAEAAEAALRLSQADRQRLQVALTSQGFDTRGSDGVFGPRTREMVAGWQKARGLPLTGFLTAAHQQQLQREAAAALQKYDDEQKKTEDEKKKVEDDRKKAEEEAKAKGTAAAPAPAPGGALDGTYGGMLGFSSAVATFVTVNVSGTSGRGEFSSSSCGSYPFSLTVGPDGQLSGTVESRVGLNGCLLRNYTATGRIADGALLLDLRGPWGNGSVKLLKGVSAPAGATTPAPSPFDGYYDGNLNLVRTGAAATMTLGFNVRIAGTTANGAMQTRNCGYSPFSLTVAADGRLSGTATLPDHSPNCTPASFTIVGRAIRDSLELNLSAAGGRISGSLRKSASP